jgi:polysaccharide pyruvyl transferase CsaB
VEKVLLLGYFGAGNFGDDALLCGWLLQRRQWLGERGLVADITAGGELDPLAGFSEGAALRGLVNATVAKREALRLAAGEYRALIAPGGSLLQDATSVRSLAYYLWIIRKFIVARQPVFLLNQGLGPLSSWLAFYFTPRYVRGATLVTLRDQDSYNWVLSRGLKKSRAEFLLACDPMLKPLFSPVKPPAASLGAGGEAYALVIAKPTRDLPHPGDDTPEEDALGQLIRQARRTTGARVIVAALHVGQDRQFCRQAAAAAGDGAANWELPDGEDRYNRLLGLIAGAELVISYRLHGLVCAAAYGVPALGVAYDPKIISFCNEMALPYCFPATVHEDTAQQDLRRLWQDRAEVAEVMAERRARMLAAHQAAEDRFDELW